MSYDVFVLGKPMGTVSKRGSRWRWDRDGFGCLALKRTLGDMVEWIAAREEVLAGDIEFRRRA